MPKLAPVYAITDIIAATIIRSQYHQLLLWIGHRRYRNDQPAIFHNGRGQSNYRFIEGCDRVFDRIFDQRLHIIPGMRTSTSAGKSKLCSVAGNGLASISQVMALQGEFTANSDVWKWPRPPSCAVEVRSSDHLFRCVPPCRSAFNQRESE
jgi:hypothetical protein